MRKMASEAGELGPEFDEVVGRLKLKRPRH
jgi:hypothetical protein